MIYLLVVSLCIMFGIAFYITNRDILSPWVITIIMFLISAVFAMLNVKKWNFTLSPTTVAVILFAVMAFGVGVIVVNLVFEKYPATAIAKENHSIDISPMLTIAISIFMAACGLYLMKKTYALSIEAGNPGGYGLMLEYARKLLIQTGHSLGRVCTHISIFSKALGAIYLYAGIRNIVNSTFRWKHILYFGPVFLYLGIAALGTGRTFMIEFLAMCLMFYFISGKKKNGWENKGVFKIIFFGCAVLILFFCAFTLFGYLTGKSQGTKIFDMISIYTGLSIPSLDTYLSQIKEPSYFIGEETLYGIWSILRRLGMHVDETIRHLEFVNFGDATGNVYTSLRRYINDYGYVGMIIIQIYLGMLYSCLYNLLRRGRFFGLKLIVYGYLAYPLVMQGIDELILSSFGSTTFIYLLIYTFLFYFLLIGRKRVVIKNEH